MKVLQLHPWELTTGQARALQERLRSWLEVRPLDKPVRLIAGCDVAYEASGRRTRAVGGVVVLQLDSMRVVDSATSTREVDFPYIPGLLTFREAPALLAAFEKIEIEPDVIIVDGHGMTHPRGFGLACHIGLLLDRPTIGCAKKPLSGTFTEVGPERGDRVPVWLDGRAVGAIVRTRRNVKPVFVSIGHRVDVEGAVDVILRTSNRYRLPEPVRQAHRLVTQLRGRIAPSRR